MLNFLKKIVSPPSPVAEPIAAPPAPAPVDPYMLGLRDAVLSGWFNQETDELFSGFPISAEDTVLDVGCGDGGNVHFCAMRGARIIIADIDAEKIARTRERLADTPARELECLVSDCDPLPLADATATRVVSTEVIEHVDDPRQFLAELV
ncbi:class I SAM-dependent methyltransferase, partial [Pseudomonas aeruginosa]